MKKDSFVDFLNDDDTGQAGRASQLILLNIIAGLRFKRAPVGLWKEILEEAGFSETGNAFSDLTQPFASYAFTLLLKREKQFTQRRKVRTKDAKGLSQ